MNACPTNFVGSAGICIPTGEAELAKFSANPKITRPYDNDGFKQTLFYTFFIAIGCGLIRIVLTHCLPRYMPIISFVVAILLLLVFAIFSFVSSVVSYSLGGWAIPFGIFLIVLAIILTVMLCLYINEIKFQGYML